MPGIWHTCTQNLFPESHQEVRFDILHFNENDKETKRSRIADVCPNDETVLECQHSRITLTEVNARNDDYSKKFGKKVIWLIDCTDHMIPPKLISEEGEKEVWLIEFEKKWHVDSMRDCKILFADFGERIFRIPIEKVIHRIICVFGSWKKNTEFVAHLISDVEIEIEIPTQCTLTVAQDPHGSGKTYSLTRMILFPEKVKIENRESIIKSGMFIIVTKPHSAKEVVYSEFILHLKNSGLEITESYEENRKYIVKFTRSNGDKIMCIFGTADSLMYNLSENRVKGSDVFMNLVKTIHKHGPTKLQGPKGRFKYAGEQPRMNNKTTIITDEATMLPESYADAFSTLMSMCNVNLHLAGDVQQSTYYEDNLLTRVVSEYNSHGQSLPSFPSCKTIMDPGNEVRRFGPTLVNDFRNVVMRGFHENPTHNLNIKIPIAAPDVVHTRGLYSVHEFPIVDVGDDAESESVIEAVDCIMEQLRHDVYEFKLLPNDLILVTPFVTSNIVMDEVQTCIQNFWEKTFTDTRYVETIKRRDNGETERIYDTRIEMFQQIQDFYEKDQELSWLCKFHRSEEGKPIDTTESKFGTRIVSIHASQGDGRKVAYVVGLNEQKLKRFSNGKINLKYESLLNVAISRMKEVVRCFLEPVYDDIWERFLNLENFPEEMKSAVPPPFKANKKFNLMNAINIDMNEMLFNRTKDQIESAMNTENEVKVNKPLVDNQHHIIRMTTANMVFWAHVVSKQGLDHNDKEQALTIFRKVARAPLKESPSKTYYKELRVKGRDPTKCIPILYYDTGASSFQRVQQRILRLMKEVQISVKKWIDGDMSELDKMTPEHTILLQYAVEVIQLAEFGLETVKMENIYDIVHSFMNSDDDNLVRHYEYIQHLTSLFNKIISDHSEHEWSWKIFRHLTLGNKRTHCETQSFQLTMQIPHLFITDTTAMPIILCPSIDDMCMGNICAQAILRTLVCLQPVHTIKDSDHTTPTWEYLTNRQIRMCFVPLNATPIYLDVTNLIEEHIQVISDWICEYVKIETESAKNQAIKLANHYQHDFEEARETISLAHKIGKCPDYIRDAFNEADGHGDIEQLLMEKLTLHLKTLNRDIKRR